MEYFWTLTRKTPYLESIFSGFKCISVVHIIVALNGHFWIHISLLLKKFLVVRFIVDKNLKVKSKYSLVLGQSKQNLYRSAYSRIQRAIKIGAHIEAVALIESIMSDRFESALAVMSQEQVHASTLGALISKFDKISELDPQLKSALYVWNDSRAFVIHQMVKMTNEESSTWLERMAFARRTAKEGVVLLGELRKVTDKAIRNAIKARS